MQTKKRSFSKIKNKCETTTLVQHNTYNLLLHIFARGSSHSVTSVCRVQKLRNKRDKEICEIFIARFAQNFLKKIGCEDYHTQY